MKKTKNNTPKNVNKIGEGSRKVLLCAYAYRFFFLPILVIVAMIWRSNTLLCMGSGFLAFAIYSFIGYKCHWDHIYCAFQSVQKDKMTPENIQWDTIEPFTALRYPIAFGIMGTMMVIYQLFYM